MCLSDLFLRTGRIYVQKVPRDELLRSADHFKALNLITHILNAFPGLDFKIAISG